MSSGWYGLNLKVWIATVKQLFLFLGSIQYIQIKHNSIFFPVQPWEDHMPAVISMKKKKCMKARGVFSHTVGGRICAYSISSQSGPFPFGCLVRIPWAPSGIFGAHQFPFTHVPLDPCAGTDIESQEALKPRTPLSPLNKLLQCNLTCGTDKTTLTELFPAK